MINNLHLKDKEENKIENKNEVKINFYSINTAKPVGSACLCNALYRDTCNALHRYKKA